MFFFIFCFGNIFGQSTSVKIFKIYYPDTIIEQEINLGISLNETELKNLTMTEVVDERYLQFPNLRVFGTNVDTDQFPIVFFFFYNEILFGVLSGYHFNNHDIPEPFFIKDEIERERVTQIYNEVLEKERTIHNQIVSSLQNRLNLSGSFEETPSSEKILSKHISPNLKVVLQHDYWLVESNAFATRSDIAVFYYDPAISSEITEEQIIDMFSSYFGLIGTHYILDDIWEK
jgi:hypothetical protein